MAKIISIAIQDKEIKISIDTDKDGISSAEIIARGNLKEAIEEIFNLIKGKK